MKSVLRILQVIYSIYAFLVFIILMFILFPFIALASLLGPVKGGNIIYSICRVWTDIALFMWGIHHVNIYEAPKAKDHAAVFIFNHISYMDIPVLMKAFRKQPVRVLAKAEMGKVPIFGFIYRKATVMVDRSNPQARAKSITRLKYFLQKNVGIVLAPEGTFNMTGKPLKEFYDGAFKVAIETGTVIQPVIFLDAYDRLHYRSIFSLTPGKSRAVFLEEIAADKMQIEDLPYLKQLAFEKMEAALIRYKATWITTIPQEASIA